MTTFLTCVLYVLQPFDCAPPPPANGWEGFASGYAPGVMERVVDTRQMWGHLPPDDQLTAIDGYVAVLWCELIGEVVTLHHWNGGGDIAERRVMVADCAAEDWATYLWMIETPYAVELGGRLWEELGPGWVWLWRGEWDWRG